MPSTRSSGGWPRCRSKRSTVISKPSSNRRTFFLAEGALGPRILQIAVCSCNAFALPLLCVLLSNGAKSEVPVFRSELPVQPLASAPQLAAAMIAEESCPHHSHCGRQAGRRACSAEQEQDQIDAKHGSENPPRFKRFCLKFGCPGVNLVQALRDCRYARPWILRPPL